jgi:ribosome assembly protein 1
MVDFFKVLEDNRVNQKLIRYIRDSTSCFGPRRLGSNILINRFNDNSKSFFHTVESLLGEEILPKLDITKEKQERLEKEAKNYLQKFEEVIKYNQTSAKELNSAMISGFDLATCSGPLMDEPMQGAIFIIEDVSLAEEVKEAVPNQAAVVNSHGPFGGQVMGTLRALCKKAFLNSDPRIVEGMYLCSMQASPETYGVVYNVIHRFRGRVIHEEIQNGTNFFLVDALIPILEGFEFNDHILKMSCGVAQPQLVFHGYEVNANNDPLFLPRTAEELADHGTGDILVDNIAKKIIEKVRKQKGLIITQKILLDGGKQRTLTKMR